MQAPATFSDLLTAIRHPRAMWSYLRTLGAKGYTIHILIDDMERGERMAVHARVGDRPGAPLNIYTTFMGGYCYKRNAWTTETGRTDHRAPNKRGEKELLAHVAAVALERYGYPNPTALHVDPA